MSDSVTVTEIPMCDIKMCGEKATVDGRTIYGPWAYMCDRHWQQIGVGRLGTGYGQQLKRVETAT